MDALGLSRLDVTAAVLDDLKRDITRVGGPKTPFNSVVEVGGRRVQYAAVRLPDGTINVGRIHLEN